ncbi:MarR family transcriptional regulator [Alginatibacterium sediminis]|uniref:MarR family transcriptional regulator n=1 Tax=Alginatibacterium sediminis TaxID=2164068 RepID=A0A420E5Q3_9ALTE|nr:MarR family transcriptional regulator [Alginatibacterium sediminis]RKF12774.1 MarR family transcriptional regulator [Alginatibacterium sediminis]
MNKPCNAEMMLENQLCFSIYSLSNAMTRAYRPILEAIDLTYLQYIVMMVLWQEQQVNVKVLGERLHLDSGTLTPLLKRLDSKGLIMRRRCEMDERVRLISLTDEGKQLQTEASKVPSQMRCHVDLDMQEVEGLKLKVDKLLMLLLDSKA